MAYSTMLDLAYLDIVPESEYDKIRTNWEWLASLVRIGSAISGLANGSELLPKYGALAYHNANISHATSGAWQQIATLNSEFWDTDGIHSLVTNTGRLTFARAGMYNCHAAIQWAGHATGVRGIRLTKNGVDICQKFQNASAGFGIQRISINYYFAASDYLEFGGYQDSGAALNMQANSVFGLALNAEWIGVSP